MDHELKCIGGKYPIQDAAMKVTGEQIYVQDMKLPGMLHARLYLSPVAHGTIRSIDTAAAEAIPGVVRIFTHENTPETLYNNYAFYVDQAVPKDERLFNNKARYLGDRLAAVVAETPQAAREAVLAIRMEFDEEKPVVDIKEAAEANLLREAELNHGDAAKAISESPLVFEDNITTQKVHHAAMETHCCIADYDRQGNLTIWTPCQSVFGVRTMVADIFGLSYNKVRVIKTVMGGSFGSKQHAIPEPLAAFLAMQLRRPVKLLFSRKDTILSTVTRTATDINIRTGITGDGFIKGTTISAITDAGAYTGNTNDLSIAMGKKTFRVYRIPNLNYKVRSVKTNTAISGGCRGWGGPQICTAVEIHLDRIARELSMDPAELRLKNLVYPYDMENSTGITLGNARIRECLERGMAEFEWHKRKTAPKGEGRYRKGVGLACGGHVNGFYGKIQDISTMILKMNEDGSFILNTGTHEQGCGTLISMAQIVGEVLQVEPERVTVLEADTGRSPYDIGTFSSRVTYVSGKCALRAAEKVLDLILEEAAAILGIPKKYVQYGNGSVWKLGQKEGAMSYREIATIAQVKHQKEIIATENYTNGSNPGSYGAHFAEVEVDTLTGMARVTDYMAVHDIGRIINAGMVEGQVAGSVQMGIGMALCEEIKYDSKGKTQNSSYAKYTLINATDMPEIKSIFLECGGDDGPFGAKSLGEVAVVPVAAAVANAVNDALGSSLRHLPFTPDKVLAAIYEGR
ncbi:MAG TPA: molybdopterin cofactor-binding domain-containing protein [Negativicutes bacterium]|nr:molybdopterin cofactor-binding domain-containing protein [Negativicutes bacterium]